MAKYVFSYRVPSDFVPGSPESVAAWQAWLGGMGSSLADLGEAVIEAAAVGEVASGTTRLAGYSVVVADDMDAALAIAKGCPALQVLLGEVQLAADGRQRDIDDRAVDDIEEGDGAQQRERDLAAGCREERWGWRER